MLIHKELTHQNIDKQLNTYSLIVLQIPMLDLYTNRSVQSPIFLQETKVCEGFGKNI